LVCGRTIARVITIGGPCGVFVSESIEVDVQVVGCRTTAWGALGIVVIRTAIAVFVDIGGITDLCGAWIDARGAVITVGVVCNDAAGEIAVGGG
jgi:hypothetical protein